jgi:tRNA pseudouridine38-40 synthase
MTVQETVQRSIEKILDHPVKIYASGRTDAGVHAFGQVINLFTESAIELENLAKGLNSMLPGDIRIKGVKEVDETFHARYSAKSKSYVYCISNSRYHSPFHTRYSWHIPYVVNDRYMNETIKEIIGVHDFSAFKKKNEPYRSHVREVLKASVRRRGRFIYVFIEATGFLRYMVRNIVGTLVLVGSGKIAKDDFIAVMQGRDREKAGPTAPPQGLS